MVEEISTAFGFENLSAEEWFNAAIEAGLFVEAKVQYDPDDHFEVDWSFTITLSPEPPGAEIPAGFYDNWYDSEQRKKLTELLVALPRVAMSSEADEAERYIEDEIVRWKTVVSDHSFWTRKRVEESFFRVIESKTAPERKRVALNAEFDSRVYAEIGEDPKIKALREKQARLAAEEAQLEKELALEREGRRKDFLFVADDDELERGL